MAAPTKSPWSSVHRTAGQTHWQSVITFSNVVTHKVSYRTHSFVELGAGLNVTNAEGHFIAANPSFTITPTGAEATGTAHRVIVPGDIGSGVGVRIITPKGDAVVFQPLVVNYFDPVDGRSVLLDTVTNTLGWLVASNEIIFSNCFTHLKASIRLRNMRAGLESDLILHERPPEPDTFGLSALARLEMLTEQLEGVAPARRATLLREERNPVVRASMVEPDFVDTQLSFDGMKMAVGKAFLIPTPTNAIAISTLPSRVGKSFLNIGGRNILIEAVEHKKVRAALEHLPPYSGQLRAGLAPAAPVDRLAGLTRPLPVPARTAHAGPAAIQQARLSPASKTESLLAATPSFVLDYCLLSEYGEEDFTFRGDTTYHVSTPLAITGTTTIEGGTVVKFSESSGLTLYEEDTLICDTTQYLPAVFTSYDDNSVGEDIGGSGSLDQAATYGFYFVSGSRTLSNVRFTHLAYPLAMESGGTNSDLTLRNVQVLDAAYALDTGDTIINVFNGLFQDCEYVFNGTGSFRGEHLTVHNATELGFADSAAITNSLLVEIANPPTGIGTYVEEATTNLSSATGIFQTVEGGSYYLTNGTYRNSGTTNIDAQLKAALADSTTYAPEVLTGTLTTNRTLLPRAIRDSSGRDRGYHYPVVDYLAKTLTVENATLTLQNGVVVAGGFDSNALWTPALQLNPGKLVSLGTPTRLNRLLRANQVQENVQERAYTLLQDGELEDAFKPEVTLRFTELSSLADEMYLFAIVQDTARFEASHCAFINGRHLPLTLYGGSQQWVGLTNNLFHSTHVLLTGNSPANFGAVNNLFKDGAFTLAGGYSSWTLTDNVFDRTALTNSDASTVTTASNAYVAVAAPSTFDSAPVVLTNLAYAAGPLGRYYLAGATLLNTGSRAADAAGLYHFTTTTNQVKETNSTVDIGLHYLALTAADLPVDTDGDGLADYAEDANGNGATDASESSVVSADTDGDGRADAQELLLDGTDPTVFTPSRLAYFPFNDTNWLGLAGQSPFAQSNAVSSDAWLSKGLQIINGTNGLLKYRDTEADLNANLLLHQGAIRFWFKSAWDTGSGSGTPGRLIEVSTKGGTTTNGWWALHFNTNATNLIFSAETNGAGTTYLTAPISWQRCDWNQFVLNYTATNSALYLNGTLLTTGGGVTLWPGAAVRAAGFTVGSDAHGTNQARGLFEDLELFNHPLTTNEITENFQTNRPPNAIPNLRVWLKGELVESPSGSIRINNWPDQTCFGNDAAQAFDNFRPIAGTNELGKSVVWFYQTNHLQFANFFDSSTVWTQAEAYVVIKTAKHPPVAPRGLWSFGNFGNWYTLHTDGIIYEDFFKYGNVRNTFNLGGVATNRHLYSVSSTAALWVSRTNGIVAHSIGGITFDRPAGQVNLGLSNDKFDGYMGEFLLFNRALSEAERTRVQNYLNQRWSLW